MYLPHWEAYKRMFGVKTPKMGGAALADSLAQEIASLGRDATEEDVRAAYDHAIEGLRR